MTVSEQIIQVIDALCEKFGIAINWTGENVLPYLEMLCGKLITYEIVTSIFWIIFMSALSITAILLTKKFYPIFKKGIEGQSYCEVGWSVASFFAIICLVILYISSACVICAQIMDIIECSMFPEKYIFEYISDRIGK